MHSADNPSVPAGAAGSSLLTQQEQDSLHQILKNDESDQQIHHSLIEKFLPLEEKIKNLVNMDIKKKFVDGSYNDFEFYSSDTDDYSSGNEMKSKKKKINRGKYSRKSLSSSGKQKSSEIVDNKQASIGRFFSSRKETTVTSPSSGKKASNLVSSEKKSVRKGINVVSSLCFDGPVTPSNTIPSDVLRRSSARKAKRSLNYNDMVHGIDILLQEAGVEDQKSQITSDVKKSSKKVARKNGKRNIINSDLPPAIEDNLQIETTVKQEDNIVAALADLDDVTIGSTINTRDNDDDFHPKKLVIKRNMVVSSDEELSGSKEGDHPNSGGEARPIRQVRPRRTCSSLVNYFSARADDSTDDTQIHVLTGSRLKRKHSDSDDASDRVTAKTSKRAKATEPHDDIISISDAHVQDSSDAPCDSRPRDGELLMPCHFIVLFCLLYL